MKAGVSSSKTNGIARPAMARNKSRRKGSGDPLFLLSVSARLLEDWSHANAC